jgi:hypothetical protein
MLTHGYVSSANSHGCFVPLTDNFVALRAQRIPGDAFGADREGPRKHVPLEESWYDIGHREGRSTSGQPRERVDQW